MAELTSAAVPPVGLDDHVRGDGPEVVLYLDLGCRACAALWSTASALELRLCVRHFPIASRRPRSPALHAAAEATSGQRAERHPRRRYRDADRVLRRSRARR